MTRWVWPLFVGGPADGQEIRGEDHGRGWIQVPNFHAKGGTDWYWPMTAGLPMGDDVLVGFVHADLSRDAGCALLLGAVLASSACVPLKSLVPAPQGASVVTPARCVVCGGRAVQRHHVLSRQALKKVARDAAERRALIADERNLVWVCVACHMRHENAFRRIPFSALPQEALDFADELGLSHLIDRYYPKEPHGRAA